MQDAIQVQSALISVYDKNGLDPIVKKLHDLGDFRRIKTVLSWAELS